MIYDSWDMEHDRQTFLSFWTVFCTPPPTPYGPRKSKNEKTPEDMIISQRYTINDNHMMYGSWDMECNRQNFLPFWTNFCPYIPDNLKNEKFEKMKTKPGDIIILHMWTINNNHMMYGSWVWSVMDRIFCHFGLLFALLPP